MDIGDIVVDIVSGLNQWRLKYGSSRDFTETYDHVFRVREGTWQERSPKLELQRSV